MFDFAITEDRREFRMEACRFLSEDEAAKIKEASGETVENFQHVLDSHAIRHTMKNHSDAREVKRGQIPISRNDFSALVDMTAEPDTIADAGKTKPGRNTILYTKAIGGETFFAMIEIRTGRRQLALITLYKRKRPA